MRIAKRIAASGLCSRREAERWVEAGRVKVNDILLSSPAINVSEDDNIAVDGKAIATIPEARLWLFYKPYATIASHGDPQGRETIFDVLPKSFANIINVGRLDYNSEGALLLTNNGELSRELLLPKNAIKRIYRVRCYGRLSQQLLDDIRNGATVDGIKYAPVKIDVEREGSSNLWLTMTLTEGKNREIRKLIAYAGGQVNRLIRTQFGPYKIDNMKSGEVRELEPPFI